MVTDSETVRQALLGDAVVWAYCREPAAGLAVAAALPESAETAALVGKMLQFFPPKDYRFCGLFMPDCLTER